MRVVAVLPGVLTLLALTSRPAFAGPVEDRLGEARAAILAKDYKAALKALDAAQAAAPTQSAVISSRTLARIPYYRGVVEQLQGDKKGKAIDYWRATLVIDDQTPWESELLRADDPETLFEALRSEVRSRDKVDIGVPEAVGAAKLFVDGGKVATGDRVLSGQHLAQITCPDGKTFGLWTDFVKPIKWFALCPGGVDTSVVVDTKPQDDFGEFGPSFGSPSDDSGDLLNVPFGGPEPQVAATTPALAGAAPEHPKEEKPAEVVAEKPKEEKPAEVVAEKPKAEKPAEVVAEKPKEEKPAEVVVEKPKEEKPAEVVAERPKAEKPAEVVAEKPKAEKPAEVVAEKPKEEKPKAEKPKAEKPAEVVGDVPKEERPADEHKEEKPARPKKEKPEAVATSAEPSARSGPGAGVFVLAGGGALLAGGLVTNFALVNPTWSQIESARGDPTSISRTDANALTARFNTTRALTLGLLGGGVALTGVGVLLDSPILPALGPGQIGVTGRF